MLHRRWTKSSESVKFAAKCNLFNSLHWELLLCASSKLHKDEECDSDVHPVSAHPRTLRRVFCFSFLVLHFSRKTLCIGCNSGENGKNVDVPRDRPFFQAQVNGVITEYEYDKIRRMETSGFNKPRDRHEIAKRICVNLKFRFTIKSR